MEEPRAKLWQVLLGLSLLPGLWSLAILGSAIVVWSGGTWFGFGAGGSIVVAAAAVASHLVPPPPKLASGSDPLQGLRG